MLNAIMLIGIKLNYIMLSVGMYTEKDYAECHCARCHYAGRHYAGCRYALIVVASEIKFLRCLVQPSKVNHENSLCWTFDSKLKNENIATNVKTKK